ncbi:MAG: response regulator transcription factor [Dehalococcoidia bacterium]
MLNPQPIRVLLVDDHDLVRHALWLLLDSQPEIEVVGEAESGREALLAADREEPDIVLMDAVMPGLNGIEATRQIRKYLSRTRVIVLSGVAEEEQVVSALRAGATGYLVKTVDLSEVLLALRAVHAGNHYFSSGLAEQFDLTAVFEKARQAEEDNTEKPLTPREREVLQLIAEGHGNASIGEHLFVSVKTVEAHKAHVMKKLKTKNHAELVRHALRLGLVRDNPSIDRNG